MKQTSICELATMKDVVDFCTELIERKREAPKSRIYTIAVTEKREVLFRELSKSEEAPIMRTKRRNK